MKARFVLVGAALGAALLLGGCTVAQRNTIPDLDSEVGTSAGGGAEAAAVTDVCALVPADQLAAAVAANPVAGVSSEGEQGLLQCMWTFSDTHVVIAQYSDEADVMLPDGVWPQSEMAQQIPGASRGFTDAGNGTILVVSGSRGVLVSDIHPGGSGVDPAQWSALGERILAGL
jgi:hypothetical protein